MCECVAEIAMKYQLRRDVLVKGLHEAGWMVENPKASMYVWAKIPEHYRGEGSLVITVVPDSGTGALEGLNGTMVIKIDAGRHSYEMEYSLGNT